MRIEERIEEKIEWAANKYVGHPYEPDESSTITATRKAFIDGAKMIMLLDNGTSREKEIIKAAKANYELSELSDIKVFHFVQGAKWADKHPKRYSQGGLCDIQEEMMKQRDKRLIQKACEWLEAYAIVDVEEFRKAMEK